MFSVYSEETDIVRVRSVVREDSEAGEQQSHGPTLQQRAAQRPALLRVSVGTLQQARHHAERQSAQRPTARPRATFAHRDAACRKQTTYVTLISPLMPNRFTKIASP